MSPGLRRPARDKVTTRIKESRPAAIRNRLVGLAAGGLAGACAVAMLLVLGDGEEHGTPPAADGQGRPRGDAAPPTNGGPPQAAGGSVVEAAARPREKVLELADLHAGCPSVRDGVGLGCLAVLDDYFLGKPVYSTILPIPDAPIWADVFDDPAAARDGTLAALVERTCDVPNGDIRRDLRDACAARSMVEQAILLRECNRDHGFVLGYEYLDRELSKIDDIADNAVYWKRRNAIDEDVFRSAWLAQRCAAVSADVLGPLDRFDIAVDDVYVSHPPDSFYPERPLGESEARSYGREEARRLVEMAARLGDTWALSEFRGDSAHVERLFRSDPLQAYVHAAELEVGKVRRRYHREHLEGLTAREDAELRDLDQRYPKLTASRAWQRAKNIALLGGDHAAVRRLDSRDPLAGLSSGELDEFRERNRAHSDQRLAILDEYGIARREIRARRERDQRMVRLAYAIVVEEEAERVGLDVDIVALYERAAPFSDEDLAVARERARGIADARRALSPSEED